MPPHRGRAPALDDAEQRAPGPVEHLAHRGLGACVEGLHGERAAAPQAYPEPTAEVAAAARAVEVLHPELDPADLVLQASEGVEELPFTELAEPRVGQEMAGAQFEVHGAETPPR